VARSSRDLVHHDLDHSEHAHGMRLAIEAALENASKPFGAVIFERATGRLVARGVNATDRGVLLHGEVVALNALPLEWFHAGGAGLTLYTTAEPCVMCQAAILWAGIDEVVYGVSVPDLVRLGWRQFSLRAVDVAAAWSHHSCRIIPDVLRDDCLRLFKAAAVR
jgi:tRNA(adenine34) deaminase